MRTYLLILLFLGCSGRSLAHIPPLEREVSLSVTNETFREVLGRIQDQTGLIFSYKSTIISGIGPVSLQLGKRTVREVLARILPAHLEYKARDNYIILKEKPAEKRTGKTEISGYVIDKRTEKKVANVTIYDKESLQSVTSDEYGYYSITVPRTKDKITITKDSYKDTVIVLAEAKSQPIQNITLTPERDSLTAHDTLPAPDKLRDIGLYTGRIYERFRGFINAMNVKDTIERKFQISLLPFIGTNHKLSGNVVNRFSVNVLGGFARGVEGTELGGLFNIDREHVRGVQIAGIFNIVGDSLIGSQLASVFNITGGAVKGFQGAGLMNINEGSQSGVQLAGLMNINEKSTGGLSMAGLMNISRRVEGVQAAALGNISDTLQGTALAGLFNITTYGKNSTQVAGLFNEQNQGEARLQVAGLYNSARHLKGIQVAPFNFSDSATGVPIGLFSFVKKGLHQLELSVDELLFTHAAFRTGVSAFHNILTAGVSQKNGEFWQIGYGLGTSLRLGQRWNTDLSLTVHHVSKGGFYLSTSEWYRVCWGVEYKIRKKISLAGGPSFNLYLGDALSPEYKDYQALVPYTLIDQDTPDDFNLKAWLGVRIALRFF